MRAVILAAGQGTRLRPITDDRPKCLVELCGTPLLEHQLAVLHAARIHDITVVGGYRAAMIENRGVRLVVNTRYASTNMVCSLFTADAALDGSSDVIIAYGDILYEPRVLTTVLAGTAPIVLAIDRQWRRYWDLRMPNPLDDVETLKLDGHCILAIGKKPVSYDEVQGQYTGLIKVRAEYATRLRKEWYDMDRDAYYDGQPYDNMYMTSFLQHLIDTGWPVHAAFTDNGWLEVDTVADLRLYESMLSGATHREIFNMEALPRHPFP